MKTAYLCLRQLTADNCDYFGGPAYIGQWFGNIIHGNDEYTGELYATEAEALQCMHSDAAAMGMLDVVVTVDA